MRGCIVKHLEFCNIAVMFCRFFRAFHVGAGGETVGVVGRRGVVVVHATGNPLDAGGHD